MATVREALRLLDDVADELKIYDDNTYKLAKELSVLKRAKDMLEKVKTVLMSKEADVSLVTRDDWQNMASLVGPLGRCFTASTPAAAAAPTTTGANNSRHASASALAALAYLSTLHPHAKVIVSSAIESGVVAALVETLRKCMRNPTQNGVIRAMMYKLIDTLIGLTGYASPGQLRALVRQDVADVCLELLATPSVELESKKLASKTLLNCLRTPGPPLLSGLRVERVEQLNGLLQQLAAQVPDPVTVAASSLAAAAGGGGGREGVGRDGGGGGAKVISMPSLLPSVMQWVWLLPHFILDHLMTSLAALLTRLVLLVWPEGAPGIPLLAAPPAAAVAAAQPAAAVTSPTSPTAAAGAAITAAANTALDPDREHLNISPSGAPGGGSSSRPPPPAAAAAGGSEAALAPAATTITAQAALAVASAGPLAVCQLSLPNRHLRQTFTNLFAALASGMADPRLAALLRGRTIPPSLPPSSSAAAATALPSRRSSSPAAADPDGQRDEEDCMAVDGAAERGAAAAAAAGASVTTAGGEQEKEEESQLPPTSLPARLVRVVEEGRSDEVECKVALELMEEMFAACEAAAAAAAAAGGAGEAAAAGGLAAAAAGRGMDGDVDQQQQQEEEEEVPDLAGDALAAGLLRALGGVGVFPALMTEAGAAGLAAYVRLTVRLVRLAALSPPSGGCTPLAPRLRESGVPASVAYVAFWPPTRPSLKLEALQALLQLVSLDRSMAAAVAAMPNFPIALSNMLLGGDPDTRKPGAAKPSQTKKPKKKGSAAATAAAAGGGGVGGAEGGGSGGGGGSAGGGGGRTALTIREDLQKTALAILCVVLEVAVKEEKVWHPLVESGMLPRLLQHCPAFPMQPGLLVGLLDALRSTLTGRHPLHDGSDDSDGDDGGNEDGGAAAADVVTLGALQAACAPHVLPLLQHGDPWVAASAAALLLGLLRDMERYRRTVEDLEQGNEILRALVAAGAAAVDGADEVAATRAAAAAAAAATAKGTRESSPAAAATSGAAAASAGGAVDGEEGSISAATAITPAAAAAALSAELPALVDVTAHGLGLLCAALQACVAAVVLRPPSPPAAPALQLVGPSAAALEDLLTSCAVLSESCLDMPAHGAVRRHMARALAYAAPTVQELLSGLQEGVVAPVTPGRLARTMSQAAEQRQQRQQQQQHEEEEEEEDEEEEEERRSPREVRAALAAAARRALRALQRIPVLDVALLPRPKPPEEEEAREPAPQSAAAAPRKGRSHSNGSKRGAGGQPASADEPPSTQSPASASKRQRTSSAAAASQAAAAAAAATNTNTIAAAAAAATTTMIAAGDVQYQDAPPPQQQRMQQQLQAAADVAGAGNGAAAAGQTMTRARSSSLAAAAAAAVVELAQQAAAAAKRESAQRGAAAAAASVLTPPTEKDILATAAVEQAHLPHRVSDVAAVAAAAADAAPGRKGELGGPAAGGAAANKDAAAPPPAEVAVTAVGLPPYRAPSSGAASPQLPLASQAAAAGAAASDSGCGQQRHPSSRTGDGTGGQAGGGSGGGGGVGGGQRLTVADFKARYNEMRSQNAQLVSQLEEQRRACAAAEAARAESESARTAADKARAESEEARCAAEAATEAARVAAVRAQQQAEEARAAREAEVAELRAALAEARAALQAREAEAAARESELVRERDERQRLQRELDELADMEL